MEYTFVYFIHLPPDNLDDDGVVDNEEGEGEEEDKEGEGEMVKSVDSLRIKTKENKLGLPVLQNHGGEVLHHVVGGALEELHGRVLHLPEHEGLGEGEDDGDQPGHHDHHPGNTEVIKFIIQILRKV